MSSANSDSLTSSFPIWVSFFFFFFFYDRHSIGSLVLWSNTMLNNSGESGHPSLVPDLRGNAFNFSTLIMMLAVGFSYMVFIMLRYVPSMPTFWRVFIINVCWILSKAFSLSIEMIIWFLFFGLLMWYITLIDLQILKNPCIPGVNPTWSWRMILLMYCWIQIASILLRTFVSLFISYVGL